MLARSLDGSSNKSVDATIERNNIGKILTIMNCVYYYNTIVIDVKLPTKEDLMTLDNVVFPEEDELSINNSFINNAQIIIPSLIILHQYEIEGMYMHI